jgi:hypothetical protein
VPATPAAVPPAGVVPSTPVGTRAPANATPASPTKKKRRAAPRLTARLDAWLTDHAHEITGRSSRDELRDAAIVAARLQGGAGGPQEEVAIDYLANRIRREADLMAAALQGGPQSSPDQLSFLR